MIHVRPHPRQVHPEHHAPGHRRRRRRATHQPALLDVLPQDHRRPGPGAGADAAGLCVPDPRTVPVARLGGRPGGHHRRGPARIRRRRAVSDPEESRRVRPVRRPPSRGARRVRGCLQLHEVRPVDAPGGQQDQRGRFQQPDRAPAFRRHLRTDPQRPAIGRKRGRVLHPPRRHRLHGGPHRPPPPARPCSTPPAAPAAS